MSEFTRLLSAAESGDPTAAQQLLPLVYDELRRVAAALLAHEKPGQTLQATALVHEAYLRLAGQQQVDWKNRAYFFGAAATIMRRILVDHARGRVRDKRGGGVAVVPLEQAPEPVDRASRNAGVDVEALDEALDRLASLDARQARVVELRYFSGMTVEEIAEVMNLSAGTVKRDWTVARAWLFGELGRR
jgi:RNA polymerase sigma factor (TIGR02999 family)